MRRYLLVLVLCLLLAPLAASAVPPPPAPDNAALKRQMQELERVLNNTLSHMFGDRPFAVLQEAKSAYIPGFGVVAHMELNLYPMRFVWPFSPQPYSPKELKTEHEQKIVRLKELRLALRDLLVAQAGNLTQLSDEESLAVIVHFYNQREYPEIPGQLVVQARRQALLTLQGRKAEPAEWAKVIASWEY